MSDRKRTPPKGGRKGGTRFPRVSLDKALEYAKKVVSKTHTSSQPARILLPGALGSSGPTGQVRASALKQYGLLEGSADAYLATKLAREISAAPDEEVAALLRTAFFEAAVFKQLYETFQNDNVSRAKIKQQAQSLKVHPESAEECVDLFIRSAVACAVAKQENENVTFFDPESPPREEATSAEGDEIETDDSLSGDSENPKEPKRVNPLRPPIKSKPGIQVDIRLDSSMDTEKLERQLKLLREFGAI